MILASRIANVAQKSSATYLEICRRFAPLAEQRSTIPTSTKEDQSLRTQERPRLSQYVPGSAMAIDTRNMGTERHRKSFCMERSRSSVKSSYITGTCSSGESSMWSRQRWRQVRGKGPDQVHGHYSPTVSMGSLVRIMRNDSAKRSCRPRRNAVSILQQN